MPTLRSALIPVAAFALSIAATTLSADSGEFTYSGDHGPAHWSHTPGWEACAGTKQSPIDLNQVTVDQALASPQLQAHETPLALVNNGHTVEEEYEPGTFVTFGGKRYELAQFHFHAPSEHTIRGKHEVLELHAVFNEPGSDRKVVIGQLFTVGTAANPFIARLLQHGLPARAGDHLPTSGEISVADAFADLSRFYTYEGSLTTPPCSETVTWVVLQQVTPISRAQLSMFTQVLGHNARPVQKVNQRAVNATPSR